jgi:hypothetical protein
MGLMQPKVWEHTTELVPGSDAPRLGIPSQHNATSILSLKIRGLLHTCHLWHPVSPLNDRRSLAWLSKLGLFVLGFSIMLSQSRLNGRLRRTAQKTHHIV